MARIRFDPCPIWPKSQIDPNLKQPEPKKPDPIISSTRKIPTQIWLENNPTRLELIQPDIDPNLNMTRAQVTQPEPARTGPFATSSQGFTNH
jgi:hypothetical protein